MIKLDNISFSYGDKTVIKDFSLEINKGDIICLSGESGCGKTTLLRLISGLETPQKGEILCEKPLNASVVFQENRLLPFKSALDNITLVGADIDTAMMHLNALGIGNTAKLKPQELSGGMQRRVAIARALSADFDYLILDEAFTGLDNDNVKTATEHILKTAGNRPIILVTHSKDEAELFGAKIINI